MCLLFLLVVFVVHSLVVFVVHSLVVLVVYSLGVFVVHAILGCSQRSLVTRPALGVYPPVDYVMMVQRALMSVAPSGLDCVTPMMCGACSVENALKAAMIYYMVTCSTQCNYMIMNNCVCCTIYVHTYITYVYARTYICMCTYLMMKSYVRGARLY